MGWVLGKGSVRGWTFEARGRMWLKYLNDWGWWGLFIHGPVARNGEVVSLEEKGVRGKGV